MGDVMRGLLGPTVLAPACLQRNTSRRKMSDRLAAHGSTIVVRAEPIMKRRAPARCETKDRVCQGVDEGQKHPRTAVETPQRGESSQP